MAKRMKRVYKIMLDETDTFDVECLCDYFYFEYDTYSEDLPYDVYYNSETELIVCRHTRKRRISIGNGKYKSEYVVDEKYQVRKRDKRHFRTVFETYSLHELADLFSLCMDYYDSLGFRASYNSFMSVINEVWNF